MQPISVINSILVPSGMEATAESVRAEYVAYFEKQAGFVSATFYKSLAPEPDGAIKYVNIIVWATYAHFERVVNKGFNDAQGENKDGMRVLGKGFPAPIIVSPGQYCVISSQ